MEWRIENSSAAEAVAPLAGSCSRLLRRLNYFFVLHREINPLKGKECTIKHTAVWGFEIGDLEIWRLGDLEIWRSGDLEIWRSNVPYLQEGPGSRVFQQLIARIHSVVQLPRNVARGMAHKHSGRHHQ